MKSKKKKEQRKRKLRTLILLLFLTIIMFGTSTYAWFTANKVVTINSLDVHVEAAGGIQISTNARDWKSVITNNDIRTGYSYGEGNSAVASVNQVPTEVTAVSSDCVPVTATGADKGRINMYSSDIDNDASDGEYVIKTIKETDTNGSSGKYIAFDIFLRVDQTQTVYLTSESDVTVVSTSSDRGLQNSARIAFVELGTGSTSADAATLAALNSPTASGITVWEPNFDKHSDVVVNSVAPDYGVTLTSTGTGTYAAVPYRGVNQAITSYQKLKGTVNGTITTGTTAVTPGIRTPGSNNTYNVFYSNMPEGVTKFRVYMWIEGQDIDCENNATGSDISFKVQLSTVGASSSAAAGS